MPSLGFQLRPASHPAEGTRSALPALSSLGMTVKLAQCCAMSSRVYGTY